MALAVRVLSPVSIITLIPIFLKRSIAGELVGFSISSFIIGAIIIIKYDYIMLISMLFISCVSTILIQKVG